MDTTLIAIISILILFLVFTSGVFSFSEMAFANTNRLRIKTIINNKNSSKRQVKKAKKILSLRDKYNETVTSIVILNNVVNILATTLASVIFSNLVGDGIGALISTIVMSVSVITFGEIIPKMLAKKFPESGMMHLIYLVNIIYIIFIPITYPLSKVIKVDKDKIFLNEEEFKEAIREIKQEGIIDNQENQIIKNTLMFDKIKVKNVMTSLENVAFSFIDINEQEFQKFLNESEYTRFPILNEDGGVYGIFNTKTFINEFMKSNFNFEVSFKNSIQEPIFVNKEELLPNAFKKLRNNRRTLAIVTMSKRDMSMVGVVTIEDFIEEILGEIYDENDVETDGVYEIGLDSVHISYWTDAKNVFEEYFSKIVKMPHFEENESFGDWVVREFKTPSEINDGAFFEKNNYFQYDNLIIWVKNLEEGEIIFEVDIIN